jgi:hypothetical protein
MKGSEVLISSYINGQAVRPTSRVNHLPRAFPFHLASVVLPNDVHRNTNSHDGDVQQITNKLDNNTVAHNLLAAHCIKAIIAITIWHPTNPRSGGFLSIKWGENNTSVIYRKFPGLCAVAYRGGGFKTPPPKFRNFTKSNRTANWAENV